MDKNRNQMTAGEGRLPGAAPLANPYVPFQNPDPPLYDAREAMERGTLFPGLDLPFGPGGTGRRRNGAAPCRLQQLQFAVQELALYLDTHRDDRDALQLYRNYQDQLRKYRQAYVERRGPLSHMSQGTREEYAWAEDPWPWEYSANKEV